MTTVDYCFPVYDKFEPLTFFSYAGMSKINGQFLMEEGNANIVSARNKITSKIRSEFSLWIDSDIGFPQDALNKLIVSMNDKRFGYEAGIVTGIYRARREPHNKEIYDYDVRENAYVEHVLTGRNPEEIGACGAGFLLVRNEIFVDNDWSKINGLGEDISLCWKVRNNTSFKILAHPDVVCKHVTKSVLIGE